MTTFNHTSFENSVSTRRNRNDIVTHVIDFEESPQNQSQWAADHGIPRTTLSFWLQRKKHLDASPALIQFFESPDGVAFLHRLVSAAHFEFTKNGVASIHNVSNFLDLCGLSVFVASSYGTHQSISTDMDSLIVSFAESEQERLSAQMEPKKISLAEDETFHPETCLVAMEPYSNFIILEKYAPNRTGTTWNEAVEESLSGLPVEVIQCASDEGSGLLNHVKKGLKVHHSPDTFHVTNEISKGTSGPLASAVRKTEKKYQKAVEATEKEQERRLDYEKQVNTSVRRHPDFDKRIEQSKAREQLAKEEIEQAQKTQETVQQANREIGQVYHPYDLESGQKQDADTVEKRLNDCFEKIHTATENLSKRCKERIDKAQRVVGKMTATITFFFSIILLYVENMALSPELETIMLERLIPGFYLRRAAKNEKDPQRKEMISQKSDELLKILYDRDGPLADCNEQQLLQLEKGARECVHFFQRSSSCVEGRNAQLSLRHHGLHRLSDLKLKALTAVHNYYIKRTDGTTAAERFFGMKPKDMFEYLLDHMDLPARPRVRLQAN